MKAKEEMNPLPPQPTPWQQRPCRWTRRQCAPPQGRARPWRAPPRGIRQRDSAWRAGVERVTGARQVPPPAVRDHPAVAPGARTAVTGARLKGEGRRATGDKGEG